tara:strand:- start:555 stop:944 length:390 start_codon:yes stop_codon:yes gene_type:complete
MAANQLQTLINITGNISGQTDTVSISANQTYTVTTPNLTSGGLVSTSGLDQEVIPAAGADAYLYVKNSGTNGGGGGTNITDITLSAGTSFGELLAGEFCFIPIKSGAGVKIKFISGDDANIIYAVFTRA